eukprot:11127_1
MIVVVLNHCFFALEMLLIQLMDIHSAQFIGHIIENQYGLYIYKYTTWFIWSIFTTNTIINNTNIQFYNITVLHHIPTCTSINPSDMPTETPLTYTPTHLPSISSTCTYTYIFVMGLVLEFENANAGIIIVL